MGFYDTQGHRHHMERHEAGVPLWKCKICSIEVTTKYELCLHSKSHGIFPKRTNYVKKALRNSADGSTTVQEGQDRPLNPNAATSSKPTPAKRKISIKIKRPKKPIVKEVVSSSESESEESAGDSDYTESETARNVVEDDELRRVTRSRKAV